MEGRPCHLCIDSDAPHMNISELRDLLSTRNDDDMARALKSIIQMAYNGYNVAPVIMDVITNATPSENKTVQRLLMLLWPFVEMLDKNGMS